MMKFILFLTILLSMGISRPYSTRNINVKIISYYKTNPKVWGSYRLDKEYIFEINSKNKKKSLLFKNIHKFSNESLLFDKNKLFIIQNNFNIRGISRLKVKSFPYKRYNKKLTIELFKKKNDSYEIFYTRLLKILDKHKNHSTNHLLGPNYLYIGNMECQKQYKSFKCITNLTLSL